MIGFLPVGRGLGAPERHLRLVAVLMLPALITACSAGRQATTPAPGEPPPPPVAPEVSLTTGDATIRGKIVTLGTDSVSFLASPYWGVDVRSVALSDIRRITLKREGQMRRFFGIFFFGTFAVAGLAMGSDAHYDVDYSDALAGAVGTALLAGLLGALAGSLTDTVSYAIDDLSPNEQRLLIWRLMGREGTPPPLEEPT